MFNVVILVIIELVIVGIMCLDGENFFGLLVLLFFVIIFNLCIVEDEGFNFGDDIIL